MKNRGVFVGEFSADDLEAGKDKEAVAAAEKRTGLGYTNTEFVRRKGEIVGLKIWVCDIEQWEIPKMFRL